MLVCAFAACAFLCLCKVQLAVSCSYPTLNPTLSNLLFSGSKYVFPEQQKPSSKSVAISYQWSQSSLDLDPRFLRNYLSKITLQCSLVLSGTSHKNFQKLKLYTTNQLQKYNSQSVCTRICKKCLTLVQKRSLCTAVSLHSEAHSTLNCEARLCPGHMG